jgi:asparagine synthase (glutamine-hydrolysing)
MCGIAGIVELRPSGGVTREALERMSGLLRHRGPDDGGVCVIGAAGLAHRRLSIIDLSPGGHQPMVSADGSLTIVFNGEIYNFLELRAELEALGHVFRTRSDTEVLLKAYEVWGTASVERLNGMYAFAIWDEPRRRLFAARDRLGKKPFYYAHTGDRFVFGSEIKAVIVDPSVSREVDPSAVDEYLSHMAVGGPRTIFRHVRKLPPAHWLLLEAGNVTIESYWQLSFRADDPPRSEQEYLEGLETRFRDAVRRRMISDVPLGAFLSGGVDSSMVVAMMARHSDRPVKTFTIGFDEPGYSEIEDARLVARHLCTEHAEYVVKPEAISILPDLVWHFDEPFGDSSMIPTYYVCQMARREATVALSGDGGDEIFAGYTRYLRALEGRRWGMIPAPIRRGVLEPIGVGMPMDWPGRNQLLAIARHSPLAPGYGLGLYPYIKDRLYSPQMRSRLRAANGSTGDALATSGIASLDLLSRLQYLDTMHYLPDDILTKVDRASMAHALEVRAPLLDYTLVEYMATVPPSLKLKGGVAKYLFKKLGARYLPDSVFTKRKQGFGVPKGAWFQRDLKGVARERLLDPRTLRRGYFRRDVMERILANHEAGRRDYSDWIWCLLVLEEWHRTFIDAETRRV